MQFLTDVINICDVIDRLRFSGGSTLSSHDLNDARMHLMIDLKLFGPGNRILTATLLLLFFFFLSDFRNPKSLSMRNRS